MMSRKVKSLFPLTGLILAGLATTVFVFSFSGVSSDSMNAFCGHLDSAVLDKELPISHPVNRCAAEQSQAVSWSAWFSGRSSSYQFHFIDLLELLSRSGDTDSKNPTNTN